MANRFYEPLPRCYFCASAVEGELFVWGGDTSNFRGRKRELASTIDRFVPKVVYKPHQKVWDLLPTRGSSPPGLQHGACTTIGHCLYVYGGWGEGTKHGSLHQFNVLTRTWTQLSAHTIDGPRKKTGFGMVSHGEKLVVFGGYCDDISVSTQPGASYDDGWTNELHTFDCKEGKHVLFASGANISISCYQEFIIGKREYQTTTIYMWKNYMLGVSNTSLYCWWHSKYSNHHVCLDKVTLLFTNNPTVRYSLLL